MCQEGLFKAIEYFGSQRALAKAMGVPQSTISRWLNGERKIPEMCALWLFIETDAQVPLQELVPFHTNKKIRYLLERGYLLLKNPAIQVQEQGCICSKCRHDNCLLMSDSNFLYPFLYWWIATIK